MTAKTIIECADNIRPNIISTSTKLEWLYAIEKQVCSHMSRYGEADAKIEEIIPDTKLILPLEYKDIYAYYIVCMIDLTNQDVAMYNNSCAYFNELFVSWQKKWRRENLPQKKTKKSGDV